MGVVSIADIARVLFIVFCIVLAYMHGFEVGKRSYDRKTDDVLDVLDAFRDGYNCGYAQGVHTERKSQWKN